MVCLQLLLLIHHSMALVHCVGVSPFVKIPKRFSTAELFTARLFSFRVYKLFRDATFTRDIKTPPKYVQATSLIVNQICFALGKCSMQFLHPSCLKTTPMTELNRNERWTELRCAKNFSPRFSLLLSLTHTKPIAYLMYVA